MELALVYRKLGKDDFKVLRVLDSLLGRYEYVPLDIIERRSALPPLRLTRALDRLSKVKAIVRRPTPKVSYRITYIGLDLLAVYSLSRKDAIAFLGTKIGTGKESEIYIAKDSSGRLLAIKFYKIGRVSFQKVKRVRQYLVDEPNWMIRSKIAAEREFKALKDLSKYTDFVPKVYAWDRHAVVMDYIKGIELYRYKVALKPESILLKILDVLRKAYLNVGIVHGDLSEYNIVVSIEGDEEVPYIIDWPQYVYRDDPQHEVYLRRDVEHLLKFFKRRYRITIDVERAIRYVRGEEESIS